MARSRNNYERLLKRTVANTDAVSGDPVELRESDIEQRGFTEARHFQKIFREFKELLREHEGAFGTIEEMDYDTGFGVSSHTTFGEAYNASVEGLQKLRELLENANEYTALDHQDVRRREEMFQQYFRAISHVEGTAVLRLIAEDMPDREGEASGMRKVENDMPLSSSAIEVVNIAHGQSTRRDAIALKQTMVERAAKAYDVPAASWVFDIVSKALLQFDKLTVYPRNIDDCMEEIYMEALTARDATKLVLPLSTMIEYQLVKIARLQQADPQLAQVERVRVQNAATMLRDFWAKQFPEIAVKYEAMLQAVDSCVEVIHAHDMYKQNARQQANKLNRQRQAGDGILDALYD